MFGVVRSGRQGPAQHTTCPEWRLPGRCPWVAVGEHISQVGPQGASLKSRWHQQNTHFSHFVSLALLIGLLIVDLLIQFCSGQLNRRFAEHKDSQVLGPQRADSPCPAHGDGTQMCRDPCVPRKQTLG